MSALAVPFRRSVVSIVNGGVPVALATVVDSDGYAVTKATHLPLYPQCRLPDGSTKDVEVIGVNKSFDVAVIRLPQSGANPVTWAEGKVTPVGTVTLAVGEAGNMLGFGVISVAPRTLNNIRELKYSLPLRVNPNAPELFGTESKEGGLVVRSVWGLAKASAIQREDRIVSIAGHKLSSQKDVLRSVRDSLSGDVVETQIIRDGKSLSIQLPLGPHVEVAEQTFRSDDFPVAMDYSPPVRNTESGGPLVDLGGNVIGITIGRTAHHAGWAIPTKQVLQIVADVKAAKIGVLLRSAGIQSAKAVWENLQPLGPLEIRTDRSTVGAEARVAEALARKVATPRATSKIPAIVSGRLLDEDGKPLGGKPFALVKEGSAVITDGPTSDDGTFQFELPVDQPWHVVLLEDGKRGPRSEAMTTPTPGSNTSDVPNYDLALRLDGTRLQARLTPLSLDAMRGSETNTPQNIVAGRLQLAALHKEFADLRETLGARHPKVQELFKRIKDLRTILGQEEPSIAPAPSRGSTPMPKDGANAQPQRPKLPDSAYERAGFPAAAMKWRVPPSWGEAKNGLKVGIRVNGDARIGGEVEVELWVHNSGTQDV